MITIRKGTTNEFVIALTDETGAEYRLSDGDNLIFGVKKNVKHEEYIFSKSIGVTAYDNIQGGYKVSLVPDDTQELSFGRYVYDVGLQKSTREFYIVCPCDTLVIADTVTERV